MSSEQIPYGALPNFTSFVWRAIAEIKQQEDLGNYSTALHLALDLMKYMPPAIRNQLNGETAKIKQQLAANKPAYLHLSLALKKKLLGDIITRLTDVLDSRGIYIERKARTIPSNIS